MQQPEPQHLIEASPLFRRMQPQETEAILARLQLSRYERGTRILERGVWHGRLYIVASGQVSVLLQDEDQASYEQGEQAAYVVARLGPGECFGEMSLITGEPPAASVRAEEDTTLWSLAQTDFLALIGACPTLLQNINSILSHRLARANQHLLSHQRAKVLLLSFVDNTDILAARFLAYHIADALALRSLKRVLLLELGSQERSICAHFAIHPYQMRPSLLACTSDHMILHAHRAPLHLSDGQHISALASLTDTREQEAGLDDSLFLALADFIALYDYILLVATRDTPAHLVEVVGEARQRALPYAVKRSITFVAQEMVEQFASSSPLADESGQAASNSVFITHVGERPTIGLQDRYARELKRPVTRLLPADDSLLESCWSQQRTLRQIDPDAPLTKAVDFVARHIARQTVGIAFGGGGARGFAHLGVLEALLSYGVPLDYISACSIGAITPGMYLMGKSLAEIEEMFLAIQRSIVQWRFPRTAIFSNRGIKRLLRDLCGELRFEDLETPFAMVAADLMTRAGVVLDRGPIWRAGLACVALPGIFPPVMIGKHILVDAGMHDPVPIRLVRQMGADILLASELGEQGPPSLENAAPWLEEAFQQSLQHIQAPSPHIIDILLRTYDLAMATIGMHSIREADVVIRPKLHRISLRQFSEGHKFVSAGREAVEQAMPALRKYMPSL